MIKVFPNELSKLLQEESSELVIEVSSTSNFKRDREFLNELGEILNKKGYEILSKFYDWENGKYVYRIQKINYQERKNA